MVIWWQYSIDFVLNEVVLFNVMNVQKKKKKFLVIQYKFNETYFMVCCE